MGTAFGLLVAVVLTVSDASMAGASAQQPTSVAVRVFDGTGLSTGVLQRAEREAQAIFGEIGVKIAWTSCAGAEDPTCGRAIDADELVVRIMAAHGALVERSIAMGAALVVPGRRHGSFATIYLDAVDTTAKGAMVDPCRLLGRAVAHEIGHLLLNTNGHARSGLMRAVWSRSEMRRDNPLDWRFNDREASTMKTSLASGH